MHAFLRNCHSTGPTPRFRTLLREIQGSLTVYITYNFLLAFYKKLYCTILRYFLKSPILLKLTVPRLNLALQVFEDISASDANLLESYRSDEHRHKETALMALPGPLNWSCSLMYRALLFYAVHQFFYYSSVLLTEKNKSATQWSKY